MILKLLLRSASIVHGFDERYRARYSVPLSKWKQLPNDVELPPKVVGADRRRRAVLFAGEVGLRKGIDIVEGAWDRALADAGWELLVAGQPTPAGAAIAERLALQPSVTILGPLAHDDLLALMASVSIVIQPSRAEAFPMTVCEGLVRGCAVVGTDIGGLGALLAGAEQFVIRESSSQLRDTLKHLAEAPEALRRAQLAARAYGELRLASERVTAEWVTLYGRLGFTDG
ncbi:glycosyltransferase family 4 protein [Herbiconiux sp. SYSU D00978]|uniref:glycosyltransferase family 4 protein n=1 Tax=Herbiconiux sp. SYSU D00978 TaxID=2812562 RepID=UPI001A958DB5|nr:glycosyltransferase family 4 protein [Herbiconiux sp. SYSU D00978]